MQAVIDSLYPNRVQIQLSNGGQAIGPWSSSSGDFDPRENIEVFFNGKATSVYAFAFDFLNDQYLLFTADPVPFSGIVQVVYWLPDPPYSGAQGVIAGFALVASIGTPTLDVTPYLGVAVPSSGSSTFVTFPSAGLVMGVWEGPVFTVPLTQSTALYWDGLGFASVRIQGTAPAGTGFGLSFGSFGSVRGATDTLSPLAFDSGLIPFTQPGGSLTISGLTPGETVMMSITAYDSGGSIVTLGGQPLQVAFVLQVSSAYSYIL